MGLGDEVGYDDIFFKELILTIRILFLDFRNKEIFGESQMHLCRV